MGCQALLSDSYQGWGPCGLVFAPCRPPLPQERGGSVDFQGRAGRAPRPTRPGSCARPIPPPAALPLGPTSAWEEEKAGEAAPAEVSELGRQQSPPAQPPLSGGAGDQLSPGLSSTACLCAALALPAWPGSHFHVTAPTPSTRSPLVAPCSTPAPSCYTGSQRDLPKCQFVPGTTLLKNHLLAHPALPSLAPTDLSTSPGSSSMQAILRPQSILTC